MPPKVTMVDNKFNEHQRAWIDALKSGNYKKAKGRLMVITKKGEPKGFCCLGVYMYSQEIKWKAVNEIPRNTVFENIASFYDEEQNEFCCTNELDYVSQVKLHLYDSLGELDIDQTFKVNKADLKLSSLADINDRTNKTLKEIGEWIENNPHLVFLNFDEQWKREGA